MISIGREHATDQVAVHRAGRIGNRHVDDAYALAMPAQDRPDRLPVDGVAVDDAAPVRTGHEVLEAEDAMLAWIHAGLEGGPGGTRDGRDRGAQCSADPAADQPEQVGHQASVHHGTENVPGGAIKADDHHFLIGHALACWLRVSRASNAIPGRGQLLLAWRRPPMRCGQSCCCRS